VLGPLVCRRRGQITLSDRCVEHLPDASIHLVGPRARVSRRWAE
jgi:hypothetical protein